MKYEISSKYLSAGYKHKLNQELKVVIIVFLDWEFYCVQKQF